MGRKLISKANFAILEGFLSELLFTDIQILDILESESNQETADSKHNRVDIKVKDAAGKLILIEVQYSRELDYLQRILFSSSKNLSEHFQEGQPYSQISKIISVNILYFNFGQGDDYIYHGTTQFTGLHNQRVLQLTQEQKKLYQADHIADLYPEYYLIEIRNFNDIAKDTLDEWIYFLKHEQIQESFTAKGLAQAKENLDFLKLSDSERLAYAAYQKQLHHEASLYESSYVLGKLEGHEEGRQEALIVTARKMKQAQMAVQTIAEMTGLSQAQIENL